jgi:hypothetical protein
MTREGFGESLAFVSKILLWSFGISAVLKYFGPRLPIPATPWVALIPVLGVPLAVALFLTWRLSQSPPN